MDTFLLLLETYPSLRIVLILCVIGAVCSAIGKLFKLAITIVIASIIISVMATVFFGDGTEYVQSVSKILPEEYQETVNDAYRKYREDEAQNPVVDMENLQETLKDRLERAKEAADKF